MVISLPRDADRIPVIGGTSSADGITPVTIYVDPTTHRMLVDSAGGGTGTVTTVSVVSANGFAGTVANATTTPAITLTTTITGILQGNGTEISAASTTGTGSVVLATSPTFSGATITTSSVNGVTLTTGGGTTTFLNANGTYSTPAGTVYTGTANRITVTGTVIDIAATYVGQTSITTLGTVTTGTLSTGAVIGGVTMTLGSDSSYDLYYRGATGVLTRLANGTTGQVLTATTSNAPSWGAAGSSGIVIGTTTITSGTTTRILYDNAGVVGEYTLTGSGTVVAMATAPTFVTSIATPAVLATANDSGAIGASGTAFSDLFLASGAVINFVAGDYTLTHSTGILTANKDLRVTTVGTNSASVVTTAGTQTLTNKRITPRLTTTNAPGATPTTNTDNVDIINFTGLNTAITSMTTNLSGTPVDGDKLEFRFTDDGTARAITWGATFASTTLTLPTTTVISTMLRVGFEWSGSTWKCIAIA